MVGVGVGGSQLVEWAFIDCSKKSNVLRKVLLLSDYTEKQSERSKVHQCKRAPWISRIKTWVNSRITTGLVENQGLFVPVLCFPSIQTQLRKRP